MQIIKLSKFFNSPFLLMKKYCKFGKFLPLGVVDTGLVDCEVLEVVVEVVEVVVVSSSSSSNQTPLDP